MCAVACLASTCEAIVLARRYAGLHLQLCISPWRLLDRTISHYLVSVVHRQPPPHISSSTLLKLLGTNRLHHVYSKVQRVRCLI